MPIRPGGHLARDGDDGHGVELGVRDRGQQVDRARARRGEASRRRARGPRHALGEEAACLLVADEDVAKIALPEGVVEREVRAARDARDDPDTLPLQKLDQERRAVALHDPPSRKKKPLSVSTERG